ncbi:class I SAM-dependent methyltransferase [Azospirillum sp. RWY-5-1]|uniref:Class I SAM-dependent methyltransferase n=1 Tax=Azospirillum oleiclasticum TaxID=2735135 RepID=A0ABX2TDG2_9PROT|nr:methyltransferase domain-containing protein [Azospirillum oleiclasticum]NYZ17705.1 class I SAM-dependent methyltransferase [Azospirillum oleiclasticum]NYZ21183.1 class I SAM-dependent methyltransferase [Azospirillum oleiclasticum]
MTTRNSPIDASAERRRWNDSAGSWDRWADAMADIADKLNQPLLDAGGVDQGHAVLDLASGAGEPAFSAARRVGPGGLVIGTDIVPAMLAGAVRRAAALPPPVPCFAAADMTGLPFPDHAFDRVTCRFGIMFVPDVQAALLDVRRVLRPAGRAAFMVWGPRSDNALFDVVADAVDQHLGADADRALDPLFRFAGAGELAERLDAAGFTAVSEHALTPVRHAKPGQPFWKATLEMSFAQRLSGLTAARRAALDADIDARFAARALGGTVPLPVHVRIIVGSRPG